MLTLDGWVMAISSLFIQSQLRYLSETDPTQAGSSLLVLLYYP